MLPIVGNVVDNAGLPLADAHIYVSDQQGNQVGGTGTISALSGGYSISLLPYEYVTISHVAYKSLTMLGAELSLNPNVQLQPDLIMLPDFTFESTVTAIPDWVKIAAGVSLLLLVAWLIYRYMK